MLYALAIILLAITGFILFLYFDPLGKGDQFRQDKTKYNEFTTASIEEKQNRKIFGEGVLEKRGSLYVLTLKGSDWERGYQHGKLLKEEIKKGVLQYHAFVFENFAPYRNFSELKRKIVSRYFDWKIYRPLLKHAPRDFLQEIKGISDGCGFSFSTVFKGNMLSEFNMNMIPRMEKALKEFVPQTECTSFAAWGEYSVDGKLVIGRNTDYSGAGLWDTYQVVFYNHPDPGYQFVNIGTAGLIKCNSCMNEKGLVLGGHFLYSTDVHPYGIGFTAMEIKIMKEASTVQEAYQIVKNNPRAGAFGYLLADKTPQAAVLETCANHTGLKTRKTSYAIETNYMTTSELEQVDLFSKYGMGKNPRSRYQRMENLINENRGKIDEFAAAKFMGDHFHLAARTNRPLGHVISTLGNLTSAVFCPELEIFWVADGPAPVGNNSFLPFRFETCMQPDLEELPPNEYVKTVGFSALQAYSRIFRAITLGKKTFQEIPEDLELVINIHPGEPLYRILAAQIYIQSLQLDTAFSHLNIAREGNCSKNEHCLVLLLQGFIHDMKEKRELAIKNYKQILQIAEQSETNIIYSINPLVLKHTKTCLQRPFTSTEAQKLEIQMGGLGNYDL